MQTTGSISSLVYDRLADTKEYISRDKLFRKLRDMFGNLSAEMQIEGDTYAEEQKRTGKKAKITKDPTVPAPKRSWIL